MAHLYTSFSTRMERHVLDKIRFIAKENKRSINKEIEYALDQHIRAYERKHGEIETKWAVE